MMAMINGQVDHPDTMIIPKSIMGLWIMVHMIIIP